MSQQVKALESHLGEALFNLELADIKAQLGSETEIEVDGRIIAATNRDLMAAMGEGSFRRDLYYRLAVVTLAVPPLRQRPEDLPDLAASCLETIAPKLGRLDVTGIAPRALRALLAYSWPGNVRELMNVVERAALLADGTEIDLQDLPAEVAGGAPAAGEALPAGGILAGGIGAWLDRPLKAGRQALVEEFERRYLEGLLDRHRGNVGRTAAAAGVDPRTLYNKMRQLGLRKERFKGR